MSNKESWTDQWGITRHGEKVDTRGRQKESDLARDNIALRLALSHALWALERPGWHTQTMQVMDELRALGVQPQEPK